MLGVSLGTRFSPMQKGAVSITSWWLNQPSWKIWVKKNPLPCTTLKAQSLINGCDPQTNPAGSVFSLGDWMGFWNSISRAGAGGAETHLANGQKPPEHPSQHHWIWPSPSRSAGDLFIIQSFQCGGFLVRDVCRVLANAMPMRFFCLWSTRTQSDSVEASLRVDPLHFQSGNQLPKNPDPCQVCLLVQPFISDLQIGQIADPTPQRQDGFNSNPRVDKLFELIAQTTTQHGVLMPPPQSESSPYCP